MVQTLAKGDFMKEKQRPTPVDVAPNLRLEPERRLCPAFDPVSIATFPVAERGEMGMRVLDNCCEDHIM